MRPCSSHWAAHPCGPMPQWICSVVVHDGQEPDQEDSWRHIVGLKGGAEELKKGEKRNSPMHMHEQCIVLKCVLG